MYLYRKLCPLEFHTKLVIMFGFDGYETKRIGYVGFGSKWSSG